MRIYSDQNLNVLYIEGVSQGPCASYVFSLDQSETISAYRPDQNLYDFIAAPYYTIQNQSGVSFGDPDTTLKYLVSLTQPHFPLRFTVSNPLVIMDNDVELDPQFIKNLANLDSGYA